MNNLILKKLWLIINHSYLEAVPNAVANACPIFATYFTGDFLVIKKNKAGKTRKPCMHNPNSTVIKYIPNWPMITWKLSISSIFEDTKNNTPTGETQITQFVIVMEAALKVWKVFNKGAAFWCPILPKVIPKAVEKTTRPRMLVPETYSLAIFHLCISTIEESDLISWLMWLIYMFSIE